MTDEPHNDSLQGRHRTVAIWCAVLVAAMVGAAYAAVPIYRLFCEATGFDGTPRIATAPSSKVIERTATIRFDANVAPDLPWRFEPVQTTIQVKLGENALAFYRATNTSDRPIWGMATFNVFPEQVAPFFNKLECFCFKEQLLQPGESVEMPVSFFVDPQITADKDAFWVRHITLSYTFYPAAAPKSGVARKEGGPATPEAVQRNGQPG
jgi:cytochrome c oxidase assembly protein subunit 11